MEIFLAALIILTVTFLVFMSAIQPSLADGVYTCTKSGAVNYQDCGDANTVITNAPKDTDLVAVIYSGTIGPASFWYNPSMRWIVWSNTSPDTLIGICGGTETDLQKCAYGNGGASQIQARKAIVGLVSAWQLQPTDCYAKDDEERRQYTALPPRLILAWYCDRPGGIQGYVRVYTFKDAIKALSADIPFISTKEQKAALDPLVTTRDLTPDEQLAANEFLNLVRPTAQVSVNGTSKTRPIYLAKTDRTVGQKTSLTAPVGSPCAIHDRLVTWDAAHVVPSATSYYAVPGGWAICTLYGAVSK